MKHRRLPWILLTLALMAAMTTSVYAYMVHRSQTVANTFVPAEVTCKVEETFDGTNKTGITVKNTGNIDAYIRLRLVFHWEDSKGNVVARDMDPPAFTFDSENWKQATGEEYAYYYKTPVAPGASTGNLLTSTITMEKKTETDNTKDPPVVYEYYPVLEVLAEAIQSLPEEAVENSWGVTIKNGIIQ